MDENTTDALNNLIASIKEKMNESNTNISNTLNDNPEETISSKTNINVNLENNTTSDSKSDNNSNNSSTFNPELFLKIQKIMGAMNSNNPKKDLLLSLKPFLRQTRQDKINEYINILNIISALDLFKKGSD